MQINPFFAVKLGYDPTELVGLTKVEAMLSAGSRIFFQTHLLPLVRLKHQAEEIFLIFLSKNKEEIPVLLNVSLYEMDNIPQVLCAGMQIQQRNRFEKELLEARKAAEQALNENRELVHVQEQLQQTQRRLELQLRNLSEKNIAQAELGKVLSHDLQEPLRKISLFSSRLLLDHYDALGPTIVTSLEKITQFADKVKLLLESLEKFNALGTTNLVFSDVSLQDVMKTIEARERLISSDILFSFVDETGDAVFQSDARLVSNLVSELVQHAIRLKHLAKDKLRIKLTASVFKDNFFAELKGKYVYEDFLRLTLQDNTIRDYQPHKDIFELFRLGNRPDDLGISLAICRRMVHLLGGTITVSSQKNGETVFVMVFPMQYSV